MKVGHKRQNISNSTFSYLVNAIEYELSNGNIEAVNIIKEQLIGRYIDAKTMHYNKYKPKFIPPQFLGDDKS